MAKGSVIDLQVANDYVNSVISKDPALNTLNNNSPRFNRKRNRSEDLVFISQKKCQCIAENEVPLCNSPGKAMAQACRSLYGKTPDKNEQPSNSTSIEHLAMLIVRLTDDVCDVESQMHAKNL